MNDQSTVRIVIGVLGSLALAVVVGGIVLTLNDKSLSGELIAIGSAAAGAIGSILARTGTNEVQVVNRADSPVPVADADNVDVEERLLPYDPEHTTPDAGAVSWETVAVTVLIVVLVLVLI